MVMMSFKLQNEVKLNYVSTRQYFKGADAFVTPPFSLSSSLICAFQHDKLLDNSACHSILILETLKGKTMFGVLKTILAAGVYERVRFVIVFSHCAQGMFFRLSLFRGKSVFIDQVF